jgi:hypothetical protein
MLIVNYGKVNANCQLHDENLLSSLAEQFFFKCESRMMENDNKDSCLIS